MKKIFTIAIAMKALFPLVIQNLNRVMIFDFEAGMGVIAGAKALKKSVSLGVPIVREKLFCMFFL